MNISKSKILWIAVIIFLGAIGTGVWKYLLGPSFFFLTDAILDLVTLGFAGYKNAIYIEISEGFHETASLLLLSLFVFFVCLVGAFVLGFAFGLSRGRSKGLTKKADLSDRARPRIPFAIFLYCLFVTIVLIMSSVRLNYINRAVTHFHQLCAIVSPYVEDTEKEKYLSRFAQIQNKEDYSNLISELKSIALNDNQTVPKFNIW